jgi:DNA-binding IclR family transcriptional regulator
MHEIIIRSTWRGVMYAVQLAQRTGEIASISTEHMNQQMTIFVVRGDQGLKTETRLGNLSPMHQTASGKTMLASMSEDRRERILDARPLEPGTENTITDVNELLSKLKEIRQQGYGFNDEERRSGVRAVAAPITNRRSKELVGALAISGPSTRMKGEFFEYELPNLLREYSDMIEVDITEW